MAVPKTRSAYQLFCDDKRASVSEEVKEEKPVVDSYYRSSKLGPLIESDDWKDYGDNEQVMIEYTSRLIDTYLDSVKKNLIDSLPKVCEGCGV